MLRFAGSHNEKDGIHVDQSLLKPMKARIDQVNHKINTVSFIVTTYQQSAVSHDNNQLWSGGVWDILWVQSHSIASCVSILLTHCHLLLKGEGEGGEGGGGEGGGGEGGGGEGGGGEGEGEREEERRRAEKGEKGRRWKESKEEKKQEEKKNSR